MNQYHIYDQIGKGRHSVVYKGRKKQTVKYFAIKKVEKSERPRVLQEVRTFHMLQHDNVLKFHEWYETSNHLWLILEYCVGGDLLALLKQDVRLPEESIHDFGRDCAQALQFLHSNGIIYGDLKPSNVLLDENGRPKLCDFGLSRRLADIANTSHVHLPQSKRGTPCYMAPELLEEEGVQSFSSDLWSLGCIMYECYCGRPPFSAPTLTGLVSAIFLEDPAPLPGDPSPEFQDLLQRLLHKDPAARMSWDELKVHPFWRQPIKGLPLPPQPAFEYYLQKKNLVREPSEQERLAGSQGDQQQQVLEPGLQGSHASSGGHEGVGPEGQALAIVTGGVTVRGKSAAAGVAVGRVHEGAQQKPVDRGAAANQGEGRVALVDVRSAEVNAQVGMGRTGVAAAGTTGQARDAAMQSESGTHVLGSSGLTKGRNLGPAEITKPSQKPPLRAAAPGPPRGAEGYNKQSQPGSVAAVHALRLSRIVRQNLEKEAEAEGATASYRQAPGTLRVSVVSSSARGEDVILENNDLELDFADRNEEVDEDDELQENEDEVTQQGQEGAYSKRLEGGQQGRETGDFVANEKQLHSDASGLKGQQYDEDDGEFGEGELEGERGEMQGKEENSPSRADGTSMFSESHIELDLSQGPSSSGPSGNANASRPTKGFNTSEESPDDLAYSDSAENEEPCEGPGSSGFRGLLVQNLHTNALSDAQDPAGRRMGQKNVQSGKIRAEEEAGRGGLVGLNRDTMADLGGTANKELSFRPSGAVEGDLGVQENAEVVRKENKVPVMDSDAGGLPLEQTQRNNSAGGSSLSSVLTDDSKIQGMDGMWHPSDFVVRPIVLNRRIERLPEPTFDPRHLPSEPYTGDEIAQLTPQERSSFFSVLISRLSGKHASVNDRLNCIRYIQTVAYCNEAANVIIASPVMSTLVRSLCTSKSPVSRVELCSAVGLLVRHATHIPEELASSGVVSVLTEILRDKQEKVRRRAMASLGELVFYIATQVHQPASNSASAGTANGWHVPSSTIALIGAMLQKGEDEITQHYAVKTVENVAGEGPAWAARFSTQQNVSNLCRIFRHANSKQEHLKSSAGSSLVRLLRYTSSLGAPLLDALGPPRDIVAGIQRGGQREQQLLLNMLNLLLLSAPVGGGGGLNNGSGTGGGGGGGAAGQLSRLQTLLQALLEERGLLQALTGLLENASPVLKGKALVSLGLLCHCQPWRWLPLLCPPREQKTILLVLERLSKEKEEYVLQCLEVLVVNIASNMTGIIDRITSLIQSTTTSSAAAGAAPGLSSAAGSVPGRYNKGQQAGAGRNGVVGEAQQAQHPPSGVQLQQQQSTGQIVRKIQEELDVLLKLLGSNLIRPKIVNSHLITSLAWFIRESHSAALQGHEEFQALLLQAVEALCLQPQQLLHNLKELQHDLLPALAGLYTKALSGEMRFLAFKELCDIVAILLDTLGAGSQHQGPVMDGQAAGDSGGSSSSHDTQEGEVVVREFVQHLLLPLFPTLMHDDDPLLPTYAQKLLVNLLDRGLVDVQGLQMLNLTGRCFELLLESPDFVGVNMHALRLCLELAGAPQVTLQNATELRVFSRLGALLKHVVTTDLQDFVDPVVSLCYLVLEGHLEEVDNGGARCNGGPGGDGATGGKQVMRASLAIRKGGWGGRDGQRGEEEEKTSQAMILADICEMAQFSSVFLFLSCSTDAVVAEVATDCLQLLFHTKPPPVLTAIKDNIEVLCSALQTAAERLPVDVAVKQQLLLLKGVTEACKEEHNRWISEAPTGIAAFLTPARRQGMSKQCCWTRDQLVGLHETVASLKAQSSGNLEVETNTSDAIHWVEKLQQDFS